MRGGEHSRRLWLGAAVLAVLALAIGIWWTTFWRAPGPFAAGTWTRIADSPLTPRNGPAAMWTGREMLVIGGTEGPPCGPLADCGIGPPLTDGAAYDPATDSWRPIPDLPEPLWPLVAQRAGSIVVVIGNTSNVRREPAAYTFDTRTEGWRRVGRPPGDTVQPGAWDGTRLTFAQSAEPTRRSGIASLDPRTGTWTALPPDPWAETFDRSVVWTGAEFYLTAQLSDGSADGFHDYHLARLRPGDEGWTDLGDTPVQGWDPVWHWVSGRLVNPTQYVLSGDENGGCSGVWDARADTWAEAPQLERRPDPTSVCPLPAVGPVGERVVTYGGALVPVTDDEVLLIPPCANLVEVQAAVWTGSDLLAYGGVDKSYDANLTVGYRWTPPRTGQE